jgi:hypothetical protein
MLTLTYSLPNDKFQTVTVLGDAKGIWDLWWRLSQSRPENSGDAASNITIRNMAGLEIDPRNGLAETIACEMPLSRLSA